MSGRGKGKTAKKSVSQSSKAGLQFPVGRVAVRVYTTKWRHVVRLFDRFQVGSCQFSYGVLFFESVFIVYPSSLQMC